MLKLHCSCTQLTLDYTDYFNQADVFIMKATAELQVIPLGAGVSVREEVTQIVALLNQHDFILEQNDSWKPMPQAPISRGS